MKYLIYLTLLIASFSAHSDEFQTRELPELGDSLSSIISPGQERAMGFLWLTQFRSQVKWLFDPEAQHYVESLTENLAGHSRLKDHRLNIVLIPNKTLNAFAVPGGVVGVHSGLFHFAQTEDEFVSVMAHELAHLSQRHFARNVEQAKRNQLPTMAGLLAGLVLAATAGGDAGLAMITATQAAGLQSHLRYSRSYEQEADRLGMDTMLSAGHSPDAVAQMFERMQRIQRLSGSNIPEFLLTHPLSEQRISDAHSRARTLPKKPIGDSRNYQFIRAKMIYLTASSPLAAAQELKEKLSSSHDDSDAIRYSLAFALIDLEKTDEAREQLTVLLKNHPDMTLVKLLQARLLIAEKKYPEAEKVLQDILTFSPDLYPARYLKAKLHMAQKQYKEAILILNMLCFERPNDPDLWLMNSNANGQIGNLLAVHSHRAEYLLLTGDISQAIAQLQYAMPFAKGNFQQQSKLETRLGQFIGLREKLKN